MTILRKLLITGALALGMQFGAQAFDEAKTVQVLNFVQELRQQNSTVAQEVAQCGPTAA